MKSVHHARRSLGVDLFALNESQGVGILELPPNRSPQLHAKSENSLVAKTRKLQAPKTQNARSKKSRGGLDERPGRLLVSLRPSVWSALSTTTKSAIEMLDFESREKQTQVKKQSQNKKAKRF
jgi:hypothetical protein